MPPFLRRRGLPALATLLLASACAPVTGPAQPPASPARTSAARPSAAPAATKAPLAPRVVPQLAGVRRTQLLGQVVVLGLATGELAAGSADGAAIVSNNGGRIVTNNGGRVLSNETGQLISHTKDDLISHTKDDLISHTKDELISHTKGDLMTNGKDGTSISHTKYALAQAPDLEAFRLADATVALFDGAGRPLVDEAGAPLAARTDADGGFTLDAALPPGNLVARVKLKVGGELAALVVPAGDQAVTLRLDTPSSLGAAYVLERLVRGDAALLDRLPRPEADRLQRELGAVDRHLGALPAYEPATLAAATDALLAREPGVARSIAEIKLLLLGQANLGAGRAASEVPLSLPRGLARMPDGAVMIAESTVGRIRRVAPDGTLTTYVDPQAGQIREGFPRTEALAAAPDGTLYVYSLQSRQVHRITPAGAASAVLGNGGTVRGPLAAPLDSAVIPRELAVGPDGTLYVGEGLGTDPASQAAPPRVLALAPDGTLRALPTPAWGAGDVIALATATDGAVYALFDGLDGEPGAGTLYKLANGASTEVGRYSGLGPDASLALAPSGPLYLTLDRTGCVISIPVTGEGWPAAEIITAGRGAQGPAAAIDTPAELLALPDGSLLVTERATARIHRIAPDGTTSVFAGATSSAAAGEVAIAEPLGVAFDAQGRLLLSEAGSHTVRRLEGDRLVPVAGSRRGAAGDGGPATAAELRSPTGVAEGPDGLWILDGGNQALRLVGPDGTIRRVAGGAVGENLPKLKPGETAPALAVAIVGASGLAVGPDGRPYWTAKNQVFRLAKRDGADVVEALAGQPDGEDAADAVAGLLGDLNEADPAKVALVFPLGLAFDPRGDLWVAEAGNFVVRKLTGLAAGPVRVQVAAGLGFNAGLQRLETAPPRGGAPFEEGRPARDVVMVVPSGVAFDRAGAAYVTEAGSSNLAFLGRLFAGQLPLDVAGLPQVAPRVRRIAPDGTITTVWGPHGRYHYDPAAPDALRWPNGLAIAPDGRLALLDAGANLVRVLQAGTF